MHVYSIFLIIMFCGFIGKQLMSVVFLVGLQSSTARMTLTEELLFVRKMQAIIDFCSECKNLLKAFRLELNVPESKQLPSGLSYITSWVELP